MIEIRWIFVRNETYIFLDIEAALIRGKQYMIEIGAVKWLPDGSIDTFSELIQPYKFKKLNHRIQKLTGIQTEDLLFASPFKQVMHRFIEWSKGNSIFVTFGEFDRKVLEEECQRNHMKDDFLYPIVDFQQKYMIANQLHAQPSLTNLMDQFQITAKEHHRALADAISLYRIFEAADGHQLIEAQKTNEFVLLLTENRQMDEKVDVVLNYISGKVFPSYIRIDTIQSLQTYLQCEVMEKKVLLEDGTVQTTAYTEILPSIEVAQFLQTVMDQLNNKVLITRSGLKQLSRLKRIHRCAIPKTEVMTLQHLLMDAEVVSRFTMNGQSLHTYEKKLHQLLLQNQQPIIEEFTKRNLFTLEEVHL